MRVYWVTFAPDATFRMGCGVTGVDAEDVEQILRTNKFTRAAADHIDQIKPISFDDIEKNHVLPNMGNFFVRGIWFPAGL